MCILSAAGRFKIADAFALAISAEILFYIFAFVKRSGTMKAPVGLLSDRTVLRQQDGGARPDKFAFVALCGALQTHFHGKGRKGKQHMLTLAPCGSIRVSMKTCCCPYVSSRSDLKPAEHKKSSSAAAWIFCMEPNSFGVTRGEQPLVRASRASKVAGAFLVLFWHAKENVPGGNVFYKRHET